MLNLRVDDLEFRKIKIVDDNGEVVVHDLQEELQVNEFNVRTAFLEQPAKYTYWTSILERLRMYQENYELQAEKKKAELYEPSRIALINMGVAKPTKDQIEAQIMLDDEFYKLKQSIVNLSYNVKQLQYVVKAFEQRKDMLIQYGADLRREFEYSQKVSMPDPMKNQPTNGFSNTQWNS
nr:MAG TPA: recombination, repair and ssDNA binding protein [Herelleviridae sp.]